MSASIEVSERVEVAAPPGRVWEMITDPRVVVESVPGASLVAERADGTLEGKLAVKLGPTRVEFAGEAVPEFDAELRQGTLVAQGADKGGRSRARATTTFRVEETAAGGSVIVINGSIELAGGLAGFLQTGGLHLTRRMMKDFGEQLALRLAPTANESSVDDAGEAGGKKPINGFRLLALTVLDGARAFIRRFGRRRATRTHSEGQAP